MTSIFRVAALPAEEGDCLVVTYGPDVSNLAHLVVDGGRGLTRLALSNYLADSEVADPELLVITHVDADHIEGVIGLVGTMGPLRKPKDVWFNGYKHLAEDLESFGPKQGELLTAALMKLNWNIAAAGKAIRVQDDGRPRVMPELKHGMKVTIVSPNAIKLKSMVPVWEKACREAGLIPGAAPEEAEVAPMGLEALGSNLLAIAAAQTPKDTSRANGTSIAMLIEYAGKKVLLAADAHPDLLVTSLKTLADGRPLGLDLFKLPHHGSQANVTRELLSIVECRNYLVSTNGNRFKHPDQVAIARVITSSDEKKTIWFNYRQEKTECWDDSELKRKYAYECRFPVTSEEMIVDVMKL